MFGNNSPSSAHLIFPPRFKEHIPCPVSTRLFYSVHKNQKQLKMLATSKRLRLDNCQILIAASKGVLLLAFPKTTSPEIALSTSNAQFKTSGSCTPPQNGLVRGSSAKSYTTKIQMAKSTSADLYAHGN